MVMAEPMYSTEPAVQNADDHLNKLLLKEQSVWDTLVQNLRDTFHPPKIAPGEFTSQPVAVKELGGLYSGNGTKSVMTSFLIHCGVIALIVALGMNKTVQNIVKEHIPLVAPDLKPYQPNKLPDKSGGGGGGGDRSPTPPSQGKLPKPALKQFTPPTVTPVENPKLAMEPTLVIQPDANLPQIASANIGDPLSKLGLPSNGMGSGGGIGTGSGGGVGPGRGPGFGPGSGGGTGGGAFRIGGGVSAPAVVFKVEPEYSEEARKAKFQGTVVIALVVDEKGNPRDLRVVRALGMGLDQKAIEAVEKWRFRAGLKDGKPVPVYATIEVNFRLL